MGLNRGHEVKALTSDYFTDDAQVLVNCDQQSIDHFILPHNLRQLASEIIRFQPEDVARRRLSRRLHRHLRPCGLVNDVKRATVSQILLRDIEAKLNGDSTGSTPPRGLYSACGLRRTKAFTLHIKAACFLMATSLLGGHLWDARGA
jgi:hypothetical protein